MDLFCTIWHQSPSTSSGKQLTEIASHAGSSRSTLPNSTMSLLNHCWRSFKNVALRAVCLGGSPLHIVSPTSSRRRSCECVPSNSQRFDRSWEPLCHVVHAFAACSLRWLLLQSPKSTAFLLPCRERLTAHPCDSRQSVTSSPSRTEAFADLTKKQLLSRHIHFVASASSISQ